jgi:hypothetical protein
MAEIKISVRGAETVALNQLVPFQGDLKTLEREQYEHLRNVIVKMGFSFTVHVWKSGGKVYIIDGHQRITAVKTMVEKEGFACPPIPVSVIEAKDFAEAKRKVLAGASQYGKVSKKGLFDFLKANDIPFDDIVANFDFPEINFGNFGAEFFPKGTDGKDINSSTPPAPNSDPKMGSDGVRQVQLFFDAKSHDEFLVKANALLAHYKKTNITDTVMECVREIHKAKFPAGK